jgi:hypothetical protein
MRDRPPPFNWSSIMTERTIGIPGTDDPITMERNKGRVIVTLGDRVIPDHSDPWQSSLCRA